MESKIIDIVIFLFIFIILIGIQFLKYKFPYFFIRDISGINEFNLNQTILENDNKHYSSDDIKYYKEKQEKF